jgi:hypothetical protein
MDCSIAGDGDMLETQIAVFTVFKDIHVYGLSAITVVLLVAEECYRCRFARPKDSQDTISHFGTK